MSHAHFDWDDWRWLISDAAATYLREAAVKDPAAHVPWLRRQLTASRAALVAEQVQLRNLAAKKFARAHEMFFTRRALEQATDQRIAAYKSRRFAGPHVVDACCGIGGDLLALAGKGEKILAVDRDQLMVVLAAANAQSQWIRNVDFQTRDVRQLDAAPDGLLHIDPDRRAEGRRVSNVDFYEPDRAAIEQLLPKFRGAAVKLAPAAELPDDWSRAGEREWIETSGECRQQVLWCGELAQACGHRQATMLDHAGNLRATFAASGEARVTSSQQVLPYLYDPAPSILAAHLLDDFAESLGLERLDAGTAYLGGARRIASPFLSAFQVEDVLPLDVKKLKRYLRARSLGRLEVKKRGVDISPERLMKELAVEGDERATIVVMRIARRVVAIIAQRCQWDSPDH